MEGREKCVKQCLKEVGGGVGGVKTRKIGEDGKNEKNQ